jgi:hypothetical protein
LKGWVSILGNDGGYFDASTEKSQALRSLFLRLWGAGETTERLWLAVTTVLIALMGALLWMKRKDDHPRSLALQYAWAPWAFVMFMPQSLPYAWVHLAIPLALLWGSALQTHEKETDFWGPLYLIFFALTSSFPGTDIIGWENAKRIGAWSLPTWTLIAMAFPLLRLTLRKNSL